MKEIMKLMVPYHTHAEIVCDHDPEMTVYREEHVYQLMKEYGELVVDECARAVEAGKEGSIYQVKKQIR